MEEEIERPNDSTFGKRIRCTIWTITNQSETSRWRRDETLRKFLTRRFHFLSDWFLHQSPTITEVIMHETSLQSPIIIENRPHFLLTKHWRMIAVRMIHFSSNLKIAFSTKILTRTRTKFIIRLKRCIQGWDKKDKSFPRYCLHERGFIITGDRPCYRIRKGHGWWCTQIRMTIGRWFRLRWT